MRLCICASNRLESTYGLLSHYFNLHCGPKQEALKYAETKPSAILPESAVVSSSHATVYELLGLQLAKEKS